MNKNKTIDENIDLDYEKLLTRIYLSLPKKTLTNERFELPVAQSIIQGKQTIVKNFTKIAKDLNRDPKQLYKFFMKEISTSSTIVNQSLILNGIFNAKKIHDILQKYIKNFVLCSECHKPDTEIVTQNNVKILKCSACGATTALPKL
jgi:translation initiation factor 2 subunit 2